jgi:uncharacterized protein
MSYSIDINLLVYASNDSAPEHFPARNFLENCARDPDLLCLTWLTLLGYQRLVTHPAIFKTPLTPAVAWANITQLLRLPRVCLIGETAAFAEDYARISAVFPIRGNLVPDAHFATILRQHGVKRLYSVDTDFRKFDFLDVINPLA